LRTRSTSSGRASVC